jgi:hypothetical protein
MVFNATFNNNSAISLWSILLVEHPEKTADLRKFLTNESNIEQGISKKYDITDNANYVCQ